VSAIDIQGVTKRYGEVTALRDLELVVEEGEIYGFLGPNGAGKSTAIDVLLDYTRPTAGSASVLGVDAQADPVSIHHRVGVLPDGFGVLGTMTGRDHLRFAVDAKGADDDPDAVAERVGIDHAIDRQAAGYSKGMAQRLMLGIALVGRPDLLILSARRTSVARRSFFRVTSSSRSRPSVTGSASSGRANSSPRGRSTGCGSRWAVVRSSR